MTTIKTTQRPQGISPYQLFMLALCVWALGSLAAGTFVDINGATQTILIYADTAVCGVFFLDFIISLYRAPSRLTYLRTWGWIDLLSSIPAVESFRWGRAARVLRILRVLRGAKATRAIAQFLVESRAQSAFFAALLLSILFIVFSSIAVLQFETAGNIRTAQDAMWWAVTTMTTVGYGDTYPITPEGRLIGVFLMVSGVGVFGTFSGMVASWFLAPTTREADKDISEIRRLVADLQGLSSVGSNRSTEATGPQHDQHRA